MNRLIVLFLSILLSIVYSEDEFVYTLDQNNFNNFISSHPGVLVEFYAPWCGHCKALAPEYEKAAKTLRSDPDVKTVLAKVDATTEKTLASKYGIKGFPTLKYFSGSSDKFSDYTGGRTEATIVSWIKKRELPSVTFIKSKDEFEKIKSKNRVVLVGFFQSGSPESDVIQQIGDVNRDSFVVAQVTDANVAKEVGVDMGSLILYRQFDEPSIVFSGDKITKEEITKFVNSERFALIEQIGPENYKDYIERGIPLVWISLDPSNEEMQQKVIEKLSPYAKENKGKLSFTWINAKQYQQHVNNLGITSVPGILIAKDNDKYLYHGDIENDSDLKSFFSKYTEGSLEKFLKSQEPPTANSEPVYVLVGKTFSDVVGHDKDVLVEFYAPWCGHCKKLAPEYEKVGEAFKEVNDLVIAKIDATENDTPEEIRGFPTLIFYPKNTTKGIKYQGERTSEAIIAWIKEQASVDLSNLKSEL